MRVRFVGPNAASQRKRTGSFMEIRKATLPEMDLVADFVRSSSGWYKEFIDSKDLKEHEVDHEERTMLKFKNSY